MTEKNVLTEIREDIIIATLNRPEALNALNDDLMDELSKVVDQYEELSLIHISEPTRPY